jgi:hypothetical protein
VLGLGDEMDVILLDGEFHNPKIGVRSRDEGAADRGEDAARAEAAERGDGAQRDVHGMGGDVRGSGAVWHAGAAAGGGLPASARATPAPGRRSRERELGRSTRHHLIGL